MDNLLNRWQQLQIGYLDHLGSKNIRMSENSKLKYDDNVFSHISLALQHVIKRHIKKE